MQKLQQTDSANMSLVTLQVHWNVEHTVLAEGGHDPTGPCEIWQMKWKGRPDVRMVVAVRSEDDSCVPIATLGDIIDVQDCGFDTSGRYVYFRSCQTVWVFGLDRFELSRPIISPLIRGAKIRLAAVSGCRWADSQGGELALHHVDAGPLSGPVPFMWQYRPPEWMLSGLQKALRYLRRDSQDAALSSDKNTTI